MEKIKQILKKTGTINFLIPLIIGLIYVMTLIIRNGVLYDVNDDIAMRAIASGAYADKPLPHMFFSGFPYSVILVGLYTIIPQVDWYGTILLVLTFFFAFSTIYYIIKNLKSTYSKIICTMLLLCFFSLILPALFVKITFTKIAGFLIACSLILYLLPDSLIKKIIIGIGIVFSFSIRRKACLMLLVFFIPAYLYKNWGNKKAFIKDFWFGCVIGILLITCFAVEKLVIYHYEGWDDYYAYNKYRLAYYDYYSNEIAKLPKKERADIYHEAGVSDNEVATLENYHITLADELPSKLSKIIEVCEAHNIGKSADFLTSMNKLFINKSGIIYILSLTSLCLIFIISKDKKKLLMKTILFILLEVAILFALAYNSRIVERVYSPLFFGLISVNLIIIFNELRNKEKIKEIFKDEKILTIIPVWVVVCCLFLIAITRTYITSEVRDSIIANEQVFKYVEEHPDNFYLYNRHGTEFYYFFNKYNFSNYITLGGWSVYSPVYNIKLNTRNASRASELIFRENVYIIVFNQVNINWYRYLDPNMQILEIDRVDNFIVYKFIH